MTIRRLRQRRGWTQGELAKRAKVHRVYITQIETGTKSNPSLAVVQRIAKAFRVKLTKLT